MTATRWLGAILISLATFEACARIDDAWTEGAPLLGRYDQSLLTAVDEFGVAGKPKAHFAKWRMNSLGFRGPELGAGQRSILCIGASETFGLYEPEGFEYPRQLELQLNLRAGPGRYQVVNAGLPGQSLSSFARRTVKVARTIRPSLAVIYPSLALYIDPPPETFAPNSLSRPSPIQLRIGAKLLSMLNEQTAPAIQASVNRLIVKLRAPGGTVDRIPQASVDRFQRDLSRLIDSLEGEHVQVLLITHATRFGPAAQADDGQMLTAWRVLHPGLREEGFCDMEKRLNQVIRTESSRRNLPLVDAARWLHGAENFVEFVHFTPRGAAALASAVADEILIVRDGGSLGQIPPE